MGLQPVKIKNIISKFGRQLTYKKIGSVVTPDPSKPWITSDSVDESYTVKGVFDNVSERRKCNFIGVRRKW